MATEITFADFLIEEIRKFDHPAVMIIDYPTPAHVSVCLNLGLEGKVMHCKVLMEASRKNDFVDVIDPKTLKFVAQKAAIYERAFGKDVTIFYSYRPSTR